MVMKRGPGHGLLVVALAIGGCSGGSGRTIIGPDAGGDRGDEAVAVDAADGTEELRDGADTVDAADAVDAADGADKPDLAGCQGGGCFGDKCAGNEKCQSGWCVQHMGEGVCTQECTEECPAGWSCRQLEGVEPDVVFVCVSDFANLCLPCVTGDACKTAAGADDVCVSYGEAGNFCGGSCGEKLECPWGFVCKEVKTVDGVLVKQCISETGECPCTPDSIKAGLFTE